MTTNTLHHHVPAHVSLSTIATAVLTIAALASGIGVVHTVHKDLAMQRAAVGAMTAPTQRVAPAPKQPEWIPLQ